MTAKDASLSARRAWIEIYHYGTEAHQPNRRSPQGERGLKSRVETVILARPTSLSARRAWIEMPRRPNRGNHAQVALRKESVD